jgi:cytidylate kinase
MYLGVPCVYESVRSADILQQDLRVILTLPEEIRQERIMQRGELNAKDKEKNIPGSRLDFFERFLLYTAHCLLNKGKALIIDTSIFSTREVSESIVECLINRELIS